MTEFISKWKWLLLAVAGLALILCFVLSAGAGAAFRSQAVTPTITREPETFDYCGARLDSLCVVSFGRDAFGSTIINLYVPENAYAPFYLNIVRVTSEVRYDCFVNKEVPTSVYCSGAAINLNEGFEMQVVAERNGNVMAQGTFVLTAYLVTTQSAGEEEMPTETGTVSPSGEEAQATSTLPVFGEINPGIIPTSTPTRTPTPPARTPTRTPTPSSSYPNYP